MVLKNLFYATMLLSFVLGCTSYGQEEKSLELKRETAYFNSDNHMVGSLLLIQKLEGQDIIAGYDYILHKILFFSIEDNKLTGSITLQKEGPDEVQVRALKVVSMDEIIIANANYLYTIDGEGKVLKKLSLRDSKFPIKNYDPTQEHLNIGYIENAYDSKSGCLFTNIKDFSNSFLTEHMIGAIDLKNDSLIKLKLPYPDLFKGDLEYLSKSQPVIFINDDGFYYTFGALSSIFYYNFNDSTYKKIDTNSNFSPSEASAFDRSQLNYTKFGRELFYSPFLKSPQADIYYFIHRDLIDDSSPEYRFKLFLRVYNKHLEKIGEFELGDNLKPIAFANYDQLYFLPIHPTQENDVELIKFTLLMN